MFGLLFGTAYRHPPATASEIIALTPLARHDAAALAAAVIGEPEPVR